LKRGAYVDPSQPCTGQTIFEGELTSFKGHKKSGGALLHFIYRCHGE
jgi:hypothetical protein